MAAHQHDIGAKPVKAAELLPPGIPGAQVEDFLDPAQDFVIGHLPEIGAREPFGIRKLPDFPLPLRGNSPWPRDRREAPSPRACCRGGGNGARWSGLPHQGWPRRCSDRDQRR